MTTITVRQEVASILRVQAATYAQSTFVLEGDAKEFYGRVAEELQNILADYVTPASEEQSADEAAPFEVGDFVRLTGEGWDGDPDVTPKAGEVVQVAKLDEESGASAVFYCTEYEREADDGWFVYPAGHSEADYWGGEKVDDSTIRVGDTVRIKDLYAEEVYSPLYDNQPGTEFVVTRISQQDGWLSELNGVDYGRALKGDPNGWEIWERFVEKVVR